MSPNFKIHLTLNGETSSATSLTLGAAEAVVEAFEQQQVGNKEAHAEIRELDGSILGKRIYYRWLGARPPRRNVNPIVEIYSRALRAGCPIVVGDERGIFELAPGSVAA